MSNKKGKLEIIRSLQVKIKKHFYEFQNKNYRKGKTFI